MNKYCFNYDHVCHETQEIWVEAEEYTKETGISFNKLS